MAFKSWPVVFALAALAFILGCQAIANVDQWDRGPMIHAWMDEKRDALLYPQFYDNTSEALLWPGNEIADDRTILEQHALSAFSPEGAAEAAAENHGMLRFSGWYDDDWIGGQGYAIVNAASEENVSFTGYAPAFIPENHIVVLLNGRVAFSGDVAGGGNISFTGRLSKGTNEINVSCEREASPASLGIGQDIRMLSLRLSMYSTTYHI